MWLPVLLLIFAVVAADAFFRFRTPVVANYTAKASFLCPRDFYISSKRIEYDEAGEGSKDYTDTTEKLTVFTDTTTNTYCPAAVAPTTCEIVASRAGLLYTGEELMGMVSAALKKTNALTFVIQTTNRDKDEAPRIVRAFSDYLPGIIHDISFEPPLLVLNSSTIRMQYFGGINAKKALIYGAAAA